VKTTHHIKILPWFALALVTQAMCSAEVLRYHTLVVDAQNKILPWYSPAANAFDNYLDQCWAWAVVAPNDTHGLPISFLYCAWRPGNLPTADNYWENDVGEKIPNWVESARLYYQYSGDRAPLDYVKRLVDYSLDHGQTPTNHAWPSFPVGTANAGDTEFCGFTNAPNMWVTWDCHVDLAADIGFSMYRMFQIYGDTKYRDKAIHVANVLVTNIVPGTANDSPWPYVINSQTGANHSRYAASWDGALELFDLLIENNQGNVASYTRARATLKNWLLTYPMQNGNWVDGHSDVKIQGTNNWSTTCGSDMCLYLLEHPTWDTNFLTDVPKLLKWTEDNFVNVNTGDGLAGQYHGAYVPAEQIAYMQRMGYQAARLGAQYALWYEASGDVTYKERAYRCLAYNTYMMQTNGQSSDGPTDGVGYWWSDCYGEATRMYYYGMAAVPEWAPPNENHLLRSSSVVKTIAYTNTSITYSTWDSASTELFRLATVPTNVLAGGVALPQLATLTNQGWTYNPATGVLRVRHDTTNRIQVQLDPGTFPLVANVTFNGAQTNQAIDGFGVNLNTAWWLGGQYDDALVVRPAIDLLVDPLGAKLFRAVIEEMDWEATNDNADPAVFNWTYYNAVFRNAKFTGIWNTLRYLNQKGITNGLVISFMGAPPAWMGSNYGVAQAMEDEFAESIAALLHYARHTAGVQFSLVSPMNETELDGKEGPNIKDPVQFTRVLHKLAARLDGLGMSDVRFSSPDAAGGGHFGACFAQMIQDSLVLGKMAHWGVHNYGNDSSGYWNTVNGAAIANKRYWVTETAVIANLFGQLDDQATGYLFWDGFDSAYQHGRRNGYGDVPPNDWVFWEGEPGKPLVAYDAATQGWTPRKQFYQFAQVFRFVRPGAQRIGWSGSIPGLSRLEAFRHPANGQFTIVGINTNGGPVSLQGSLAALPGVVALDLYYTSALTNLAYAGAFAASNSAFTATLPANCVFTLVSSAGLLTATLTSPGTGATFTSPALIPLTAAAFGGSNAVTNVEFYAGATKIGADTNTPYSFIWPNVPVGSYTLTARATDTTGASATSGPVTVTVSAPGGASALGNTNEGTTTDYITDNTGAYINANRHQAPSAATVTEIRAKVGAITGRYQCAIYADSGGNASTLLRATATLTNVAAGWQTFPLSSPITLTNDNYYWLAIWSDDVNARVHTDTGGTLRFAAYPFTNNWPNPINLSGSGSFTYCMYASGPPRTAFLQWKSNYDLPEATPYDSDTDGDKLPLLLEYALGLDPQVNRVEGQPTGAVTNGFLTLTYSKLKAATDIICTAVVAPNVTGPWLSGTSDVEQLWQALDGLTAQIITARDKTPVSNATSRFMRLKVTQP
jgi:O-glycosyl hydrolase